MLIRSVPLTLNFDAFGYAELFLKQTTLLDVGGKAQLKWHTNMLDSLIGGATKMIVVPRGTHIDFYDKPPFINIAVEEVAGFMRSRLA